jgi:hypothetical protein
MGQQLDTIPIQYYFIGWKGGIQDRSGLDSEMAEMAVFLDWDSIILPDHFALFDTPSRPGA